MPAINFSARLAEIFDSASITGYFDTMRQDVRPYIGEVLMPNTRISGMTLKTISGAATSPVTLRPAAMDAHAPIRPRIPFKMLSNELPFMREAMKIGEKEAYDLRIALMAGDQFAVNIIDGIYDDQYHLILGADVSDERMRMMLLSTGFIQAVIDGVPYDYDYGFDAATQMTTLTGTATWDKPETSDPISDLLAARADAKLGAARALMTEQTFMRMLRSENVKGAMFPAAMRPSYVVPSQIEQFLTEATKTSFLVIGEDENTYRERVNGPDLQLFPDGVVTILPGTGTVGDTPHGTTPEEAGLMGGDGADVTVTANGVAVTSIVHPHPVTQETIVSQMSLPRISRIDRMHIINVY